MDEIPPEIAAAFYGDSKLSARRLGDGNINLTLLVTEQASGRQTVLQRLSAIFDEHVIEDFAALTNHLVDKGWEVPQLLPTTDGRLFQEDSSQRLWRVISFIASDVATSQTADLRLIGQLLGKLHRDLSSLTYVLKFSIPHYHDSAYFAGRLEQLRSELKEDTHKKMAEQFLRAYRKLELPPQLTEQVIHGDPKIANILFRQGVPFTYIDFDTVMRGQIWLDLGDLVRSILGEALKANKLVSVHDIRALAQGYSQAYTTPLGEEEFIAVILRSGQQIALELGMRYLIDIVEDYYFIWNKGNFPDRATHNSFKAEGLWKVYQVIVEMLKKTS